MIHEFYANEEIFVTGGAGVIGIALIEKLLRSCEVRKVYVLLRPKKNLSVEQRLEKMKNANLFKVLRAEKPHMLDRLVAIPGDVVLPNLGISSEHIHLMENVSIVFHCAATVRFDETLLRAIQVNVGGTHEALLFAEKLQKLKIFLHVSTFYSNPYLHHVQPKIYEPPMDWRILMKLFKNYSTEDKVDFITRKLIIGFPNTYIFSKNIAESMINDFQGRLPVAIFRPSIVLFALSEPIPGYPPTLMGAMGIFALVGAGILKTVYMSKTLRFDITPQDVGIKTMLYYAYHAGRAYGDKQPIATIPVYMPSSTRVIPHTFYTMCQKMENGIWYEAAFEKNFMLPSSHYTDSRFVYMSLVFTKQIFPALLVDGLFVLFGRKPALMRIVRKGYVALDAMRPFLFNTYDSPGYTYFEDMMKDTKGTIFDMSNDLYRAEREQYLEEYCRSMIFCIREYLMKENPKTLLAARKRISIKRWIYNILRTILAYYILRWFYGFLVQFI